jgi:hypothetical protein
MSCGPWEGVRVSGARHDVFALHGEERSEGDMSGMQDTGTHIGEIRCIQDGPKQFGYCHIEVESATMRSTRTPKYSQTEAR